MSQIRYVDEGRHKAVEDGSDALVWWRRARCGSLGTPSWGQRRRAQCRRPRGCTWHLRGDKLRGSLLVPITK